MILTNGRIVRAIDPPGTQAAMAVHAFREWAARWPDEERRWYETSNTIVILACRGDLEQEAFRIESAGGLVARYVEPGSRVGGAERWPGLVARRLTPAPGASIPVTE